MSVRLLLDAVKTWIAPVGRPIFVFRASGRPTPPYVVLSVAGTLGQDAEVMSLGGPVATNTELVVTSIGLDERDVLWLDDSIYALLTAEPPPGLPVVIGNVFSPTSATLVSSEGTLVHAEHRYGISHR